MDEQEYEKIEEELREKQPKEKDQMKVQGRSVLNLKKTIDERGSKKKKRS